LPQLRPEFFDRSQANSKNKRVEPSPGRVIDPGLKAAEGDTSVRQILFGKNGAQNNSANNNQTWNGQSRSSAIASQKAGRVAEEDKIDLLLPMTRRVKTPCRHEGQCFVRKPEISRAATFLDTRATMARRSKWPE
jgi:hypothetical protein